jgi:hypothetical protein
MEKNTIAKLIFPEPENIGDRQGRAPSGNMSVGVDWLALLFIVGTAGLVVRLNSNN